MKIRCVVEHITYQNPENGYGRKHLFYRGRILLFDPWVSLLFVLQI
ncbi:MAG: hypothetical protein IJV27_08410 [Prevotella sp.]|nr:hypothetical protein [Prevotella sp.]